MKNQYVADINDYVKYSIIRQLAGDTRERAVTVCWMLTLDDGRSDGNLRAYLEAPGRFRDFDPVVFDALSAMPPGARSVAAIERAHVLDNPTFFSRVLEDEVESRVAYFEGFWPTIRPGSMLFFDPDNGLGVKSVPKGRRNSAKYLYWDELSVALARKTSSVVVYQHFPRVQRQQYVARLLDGLREMDPDRACFALCTSRVAYLVASGRPDEPGLVAAAGAVERRWKGLLRLVA